MGILSDFFIAEPALVEGEAASELDLAMVPHVAAERVETVKLGTLAELPAVECDLEPLDPEADAQWLFALPGGLVEGIAVLEEAERDKLAAKWADTEEWLADGGTPKMVASLLAEFAALAQRARTERKTMYLRLSL